MNLNVFFAIFGTVLFAELGDKTQLATMLFATNRENPRLLVFLAASAALVASSAIAVVLGSLLGRYIDPKYLSWIAGAGFIVIGILTIAKA